MTEKEKAIVLGGTFPHITLIKKLKKRGYYVILIDYYKDPPAKLEADFHIQESTLDKEAVLKIAKDFNAKLVISTCIDQANVTACYVGEKLGLSIPYSYSSAINVTDKSLMKEIMVNNDIPTSKYLKVTSTNGVESINLKYPVIVKPTDSNSSKGVKKAENLNELKLYLEEALNISRNREAIIEEFLTGREIGIDSICTGGDVTIVLSRERTKIKSDKDKTQQIYGSFWPADISEEIEAQFINIAKKIAKVFHFDNTPLMIQAIVNNDGISVIEFAPRIGGGENHNIIKQSTSFEIIDAGIDSFINKKIEIKLAKPDTIYFDNYIYTKESAFSKIKGLEEIVDQNLAVYYNVYKKEGMQIGNELSSNNRVGVFTVKGKNKKDIFNKIEMAVKLIEVYDINNKPIMRKDIYTNFKLD